MVHHDANDRGVERRSDEVRHLAAPVVEQHEFSVILGESLGRLLDPALADPSCGRTTDASDLAVLLRSQRNERQAARSSSTTSSTVGGRSMGTAGPGRAIRAASIDAVETV